MAGMLAFLAGTFLGVLVVFAILEWAIFKRVYDDPLKGKVHAAVLAYLVAAAVYGFGAADGGPYKFEGFLLYLPAGLVVATFAYRRGLKLRDEQPEVVDTFS